MSLQNELESLAIENKKLQLQVRYYERFFEIVVNKMDTAFTMANPPVERAGHGDIQEYYRQIRPLIQTAPKQFPPDTEESLASVATMYWLALQWTADPCRETPHFIVRCSRRGLSGRAPAVAYAVDELALEHDLKDPKSETYVNAVWFIAQRITEHLADEIQEERS